MTHNGTLQDSVCSFVHCISWILMVPYKVNGHVWFLWGVVSHGVHRFYWGGSYQLQAVQVWGMPHEKENIPIVWARCAFSNIILSIHKLFNAHFINLLYYSSLANWSRSRTGEVQLPKLLKHIIFLCIYRTVKMWLCTFLPLQLAGGLVRVTR